MCRSILFSFFIINAFIFTACSSLSNHQGQVVIPLIKEHHYPNGLRLYVVEDKKFPSVAYHQWLLAGSSDEEASKRGVAHFLEHMMFRQSGNFSPLFFDQYLAINGAESNANTSYDRTVYYQQIPRAIFPQVALLEFDRWTNLVFDSKNIEIERKIIENEFRERIDHSLSSELHTFLMTQSAIDWRYATPVMGSLLDLQSIRAEDLQLFYRRFYRPENMVIVLVGDITLEEARKSFDSSFGQWYPLKPAEKFGLGPEKKLRPNVADSSEKMAQIGSLYLPGVALSSKQAPLYELLSFVLSHDIAGQQSSRDEIQIQHFSLLRQGRFIATISSQEAFSQLELKNKIRSYLELSCPLIDQEIVQRSKRQMDYYFIRSLQKKAVLADEIAQGALYFGEPLRYFNNLKINYSVDDLQQLCRSLLKAEGEWSAI